MDERQMLDRKALFISRVPALLKDYKLVFNKTSSSDPYKGYANIVPSINQLVEGVLYEMQEESIYPLDVYEGYPDEYQRRAVNVQINPPKKIIIAYTYIAVDKKTKEGLKPTREYLSHLLSARLLLSTNYYEQLKTVTTLD